MAAPLPDYSNETACNHLYHVQLTCSASEWYHNIHLLQSTFARKSDADLFSGLQHSVAALRNIQRSRCCWIGFTVMHAITLFTLHAHILRS